MSERATVHPPAWLVITVHTLGLFRRAQRLQYPRIEDRRNFAATTILASTAADNDFHCLNRKNRWFRRRRRRQTPASSRTRKIQSHGFGNEKPVSSLRYGPDIPRKGGNASTEAAHSRARSSGSATSRTRIVCTSVSSRISTLASTRRLYTQTDCAGRHPGSPPARRHRHFDAHQRVLRTAPVLFPRLVTMITGKPVSRSVVPSVPPLLSYTSTCSRTQSLVDGNVFGHFSSSWLQWLHDNGNRCG